jgi:serine/threonine-protein kinase
VAQADGYSDTLPAGFVVATDPVAGTILAPGDTVTVIVASGPFPVHVPSVVGRLLPEAQATLNAAGFHDIQVQYRDDTRPRDTVLEQTPPANTGLTTASDQQITLVLSNGPALPMPDLVNQNCQAAFAQLQGMGLSPTANGVPGPPPDPTWIVTAQSVGPGEGLTPGQPVNLTCGPQEPPPPPP